MKTYKDLFGHDITVGDTIVYATRDGNSAAQHVATVTELRDNGTVRVDHIKGTDEFYGPGRTSRIIQNLDRAVVVTGFPAKA